MDPTTIIGVVAGFGFILFGIMTGGELGNFWDPGSVLIVLGGTFSAVIASFPLDKLKKMGKHMTKLISGKKYQPEPVIDTIIEFAQLARKDGLLVLEERANELEDPFFKKGILLVVDAMEAEKVREILENEVSSMIERHDGEVAIYEKASSYAPAFGMIGTLVGLVNMLKSMDLSSGSSDSLGVSMATALVTTFYGCILANLLFGPIAKKLRIRNDEEVIYKQVIIEGVVGIQAGDNPKVLKEKLVSLLHQTSQQKILNGEEGGGKKEKKSKKEK